MIRRALAILAVMSALTASMAPPASAEVVWAGTCAFSLTFDLYEPAGAQLQGVNYSVSGAGTCASTLTPSVLVQTSIWGEGYATIFSCEAILTDQGSWSQTWDPTPPPVEGGFTLTGSWGAWTLVAEGPNFHGVGKLTVGPNDPAPVTACVKNNLQSVTMLGTMEFVDP